MRTLHYIYLIHCIQSISSAWGVGRENVTNDCVEYAFCSRTIVARGRAVISGGMTNKTGMWVGYYNNGRVYWQVPYVNNLRHGKYTSWYESGAVEFDCWYSNGVYQGMVYQWHENGMTQMIAECDSGRKVGIHFYYDEDGRIGRIFRYQNNELHGRQSNWYCGVLCTIMSYSNGLLHGVSETFYTNGMVETVAYYNADKPCGVVTQWFENGNVSLTIDYTGNGRKRHWHENGVLRSDGYCINEEFTGPYQRWYDNGQLENSGYFTNGLRHGTWVFYNINGDTNEVKTYEMGKRR